MGAANLKDDALWRRPLSGHCRYRQHGIWHAWCCHFGTLGVYFGTLGASWGTIGVQCYFADTRSSRRRTHVTDFYVAFDTFRFYNVRSPVVISQFQITEFNFRFDISYSKLQFTISYRRRMWRVIAASHKGKKMLRKYRPKCCQQVHKTLFSRHRR